jgi:hypothetical protein
MSKTRFPIKISQSLVTMAWHFLRLQMEDMETIKDYSGQDVNMSLCLIKHHNLKIYGEELFPYLILIAASVQHLVHATVSPKKDPLIHIG